MAAALFLPLRSRTVAEAGLLTGALAYCIELELTLQEPRLNVPEIIASWTPKSLRPSNLDQLSWGDHRASGQGSGGSFQRDEGGCPSDPMLKLARRTSGEAEYADDPRRACPEENGAGWRACRRWSGSGCSAAHELWPMVAEQCSRPGGALSCFDAVIVRRSACEQRVVGGTEGILQRLVVIGGLGGRTIEKLASGEQLAGDRSRKSDLPRIGPSQRPEGAKIASCSPGRDGPSWALVLPKHQESPRLAPPREVRS